MTIGVLADVMFLGSNCLSLVLEVSLWSTYGEMSLLPNRGFEGKKDTNLKYL